VWWGSINCHIQAVTTAYYHLLCALSACHNLFIHTSSTIFKYGTADIYLKHGGHATQNSAHTASACPRALSHKTVFIVLGRWGHRHCRACLIKQLAYKINFVSSAVTTARYNQYETGCGLYVRGSSSPALPSSRARARRIKSSYGAEAFARPGGNEAALGRKANGKLVGAPQTPAAVGATWARTRCSATA